MVREDLPGAFNLCPVDWAFLETVDVEVTSMRLLICVRMKRHQTLGRHLHRLAKSGER